MKLKDYIKEKQVTHEKAAKEIEISRQYLTDILNDKIIPGRAVAFKIVKWSNGLVKLTDIWNEAA